ncbi:hypothetical protein E3P99_03807 [Wallemia hederae]|uniref:Glutamine synthetase n=1 Tax=Wallemia hederae TaxID=1540922 RepID=A0A4T0FH05_9BASI|nr:hypothetical protein E3P99_03807 [Wallemia hederae]
MTTREHRDGDADEAYVVRSSQKDAYHVEQLRRLAEPVVRRVLGSRVLDTNYGAADVVLLTIYTALTTGAGRRTLGEEYTNILPRRRQRTLSWQMRLLLVLSVPAPHILKWLIARSAVRGRFFKKILTVLENDSLWDVARTANLIAFYLGSRFHTIKDRIFGIRYMDTSPAEQQRVDKPFEVLGWMLSVRLALQLASMARPYLPQIPLASVEAPAVDLDGRKVDLISGENALDAADDSAANASLAAPLADDEGLRRCTLCLEGRTATSAMLCGHLFCWRCADSWLREKVSISELRNLAPLTRAERVPAMPPAHRTQRSHTRVQPLRMHFITISITLCNRSLAGGGATNAATVQETEMAKLPPSRPDLLAHYMSLDQGESIQAEYIWIDGDGELRSKTTTCSHKITDVKELKEWNFDGSSTNQAPGHDSDIYLRPAAIFKDPIRRGDNILVIAECYNSDGTPNKTNYRHYAKKAMDQAKDEDPWFGIEQEYTLFDTDGQPYGWPKGGFPAPQGPYYCGVGAGKVFARDLIEAHYRACLYAGVNISGINAEVMPSQWEFQAGRDYPLLQFTNSSSEDWNIQVSVHPKPFSTGEWNGAGAHTNYSTNSTRAKGTGLKAIEQMINKLEAKHAEHIAAYGDDNELRLTGKHETGNIADFSSGVANRGCSIRIPRHVYEQSYGYFEDRRPASNIDPYRVTGLMVQTTLLD